MSVKKKYVPLTIDGLEARMAATKAGQATWADLSTQSKCKSCRFFVDGGKKTGKYAGHGRCRQVKMRTKKDGALFNGAVATACPLFEDVRTST